MTEQKAPSLIAPGTGRERDGNMRPNMRYITSTLLKAVYRVNRADKIPGDIYALCSI